MNSFYDTQDFYKKMLELQEKLRKSEDERMKLEEKFSILSQDSRNRREACINKLRMRYIDFLEEQRLRDERNHQIIGALDKIDGSLARMTARTDRLGILRKQYEAYLLRLYANRSASGATGDSGVGSHNDDKSSKVTLPQTEKERPSMQRIVTQSAGGLPNFIPQTNYPQSHIGPSNISDFNVARHTPGLEIPLQVEAMRTHGQGDGPTIVQPHRTPQLFYSSQSNFENTYGSKNPSTPNLGREFIEQIGENYPPQFSQSNLADPLLLKNSAQIHRHQVSDIAHPRSRYIVDRSIMPSQNPSNNPQQTIGIIQSDLQPTINSQSNKTSVNKTLPDFSLDFNNQIIGPYRHSTPLPGYLDYSTRYSRDPSGHEQNVTRRSGLTSTDLENVIHRNEQILPRDYLHNSETPKPSAHTSKLSSIMEDKRRVLNAKTSRDMDSNELDEYINRIRSLHRENDQSLEALDVEQNTSGDLLNATLSDDEVEPLPHPLPSDSRNRNNNEMKTLPEDIKHVLELADDFLAETAGEFSNIPTRSVIGEEINAKDGADNAKSTFVKPNDSSRVTLESDMTLDNLSISATRDDILSGTTSLDLGGKNRDKSAILSDKFKPEVMLPIADSDTQHPDIKDVTKLSKNKPVYPSELPRNEVDRNRVVKSSPVKHSEMIEKESKPVVRGTVDDHAVEPIKVTPTQPMKKDLVSERTEIHEDIEGDKVSLVEEEQPIEKVIDVIRELQPPSLQHYEKNIVEICVADGEKKDIKSRKDDQNAELKIQKPDSSSGLDEINAAELVSSQSSDADKTNAELDSSEKEYSKNEKIEDQTPGESQENATNEDLQYSDETKAKYEEDSNQGYPIDEKQLSQNPEENHDSDQRFDKIPDEQLYNPDTNQPSDYDLRQAGHESDSFQQPYTTKSEEPYDPNQIYDDSDQHYETNPEQRYAYDANDRTEGDPDGRYAAGSNEEYADDPSRQFAADPNEQYAADQNEQYTVDPNNQYAIGTNEQYTVDPIEQYSADSNQHYVTDPNEQYTADPNEQYAADPNGQYAADPNGQYAADPNEQYAADPNEQYGYYQNDPNATYEGSENEKYEYSGDQNYQQDPNQQQYENDPNQQYENDPYQGYEHDPNESYQQDPNQEYKDQEYAENQSYEPVDYGGAEPDENQGLKNETNQNDPTVAADEQNEFVAAPSDLHGEELSNPDETKAGEDSAELGKKKDKDVIKALLESDTESMIERNPSTNTESDFDFN